MASLSIREQVAVVDARNYSRTGTPFANLPLTYGRTDSSISRAEAKDCQLTVVLAGYSSSTAFPLRERGWHQSSDVITLVLHKTGSGRGMDSLTGTSAPGAARKAYEKGLGAAGNGKPDDAAKHLRKATELYPQYAAAWYELGCAEAGRKRMPEARDAWSRAIAADPDYALPYMQLAGLASAGNQWENLASLSREVIRINPEDFPGAYMFAAVADLGLKRPESAEKALRAELQRDPADRYPEAHFLLGNLLGKRADYAAAKEQFRAYLAAEPYGTYAARAQELVAGLDAVAAVDERR